MENNDGDDGRDNDEDDGSNNDEDDGGGKPLLLRGGVTGKGRTMMVNDDMNEHHQLLARLTKEGFNLLRQNRIDEAEGKFRLALEREPGNEYALCGLGDAARKRGDYKEALGFYSACLERQPENGYARFGLGDCRRGMNELPQAIEIWRECLARDGRNLAAMASIADAYRKLSDFANAKAYYTDALKIDPRFRHAVIGLGYLYYDLAMYREAIAYWDEVMRRDETAAGDAEILAAVGNCHRRIGEFAKAMRFFERVVELEPGNFAGNYGLADCCRGLRDFRLARRHYEKILERAPDNQSILTRAGDVCVTLNDLAGAKAYFDRALAVGENIYARLGYAHIEMRKGNNAEAARLLEEMGRRWPGNSRIRRELEECRGRQVQREERE